MKVKCFCKRQLFSIVNFLLLFFHVSHAFLHTTPLLNKGRESAENSVCKESNGQFADPKYCDKYYDCWEGRPVSSGQCPDGLMFNEATASCDYPSQVNCDGKEVNQPPQNLDEGCEQPYGKFANPRTCTEYTVCHAGMANYYKCDEGLAFDKELRECAPPHNPLCLDTNLPNDRPEGEGVAELPLDPDNIQPAPPPGSIGPGGDGGSLFPVPDWPMSAKCPMGSTGFYPVAKDCQSVVVCIKGNGYLLTCPQGTSYEPKEARCKRGRNNACEQMQIKLHTNPYYIKSNNGFSENLGVKRYAYFKLKYSVLPQTIF